MSCTIICMAGSSTPLSGNGSSSWEVGSSETLGIIPASSGHSLTSDLYRSSVVLMVLRRSPSRCALSPSLEMPVLPDLRRLYLEPAASQTERGTDRITFPKPRRTGWGRSANRSHTLGPQKYLLYPPNNSSPPSPDSATTTFLAGCAAHQMRGNLRGIGKGFIIKVWQMGDHVTRICVSDMQLGMLGAQVSSDSGGIGGLVESGLIKPDSEGLHWAFALRLHQRHDGGAIHTTGQESSERHIRDHLPLYRLAENLTECRNRIAFVFDLVLSRLPQSLRSSPNTGGC